MKRIYSPTGKRTALKTHGFASLLRYVRHDVVGMHRRWCYVRHDSVIKARHRERKKRR